MENSDSPFETASEVIPLSGVPQFVPSHVCLSCDVCCRFPEQDSSFRPYFTESEIQQALALGIDAKHFPNLAGGQVEAVPNPIGEGYVCPAFDPATSECRIYDARPLDCQIYPFVVLWDQEGNSIYLGWDTKCPFLVDQSLAAETDQSTKGTVPQTNAFPETMHRFTQTMAERLESTEMITILSANPQLVMRYQEDVVLVQKLPLLTQAIECRDES